MIRIIENILALGVTLILCVSCSSAQERIIEKPIVFNEERIELTLDYLSSRYDLSQKEPTIEPKMIVLHWTVYPTLEQSFEAFKEPFLPNYRPDIKDISGLNVSAHFIVDRDGTIYRLMPERYMARHVIGLNHCAIGIENVGGTDQNPLTGDQLASNIWLVHYLADKYPIEYLIGHYEYTNFESHELWLEKDDNYRTEKEDPGEDFMNNVRVATSKYNFKPIPKKID
ncbi:MAG: peptidoglycan recognition family protein [Flavobacteriaceae bacterium]